MDKMRVFASNHPYLFAISIFVANALVAVPFVAAFKLLGLEITPLRLIIPIAQSVLNISILYYLGWLKPAGFGTRIRDIQLLSFPLAIAFVPVMLFGTVEIPSSSIAFYMLALVFTGISEECEARALILRILVPKGIWIALIFTGLLFSIGHFSNLFFEDFSAFEMTRKLVVTFGFAILYGAVYLRTLNIWPLIILHTLHDFMFLISGTAGPFKAEPLPTSVDVIVAISSIAYGVYLMRNMQPGTVQ